SRVRNTHPFAHLNLIWCPAHLGIEGNEEADTAAKEAADPDADPEADPPPILTSLASIRQRIKAKLKAASLTPTPPTDSKRVAATNALPTLRRLRDHYDPPGTRRALAALPRPEASAIAQLRAGHSPLLTFLYRIGTVGSPNCELCGSPETTEHFLLLCRRYRGIRKALIKELERLKIPRRTQNILTNPLAYQPLATYIRLSYRFYRARHLRQNPTQHGQPRRQQAPKKPPRQPKTS
ncbi:hypothetical protein CROQUDRAFT_8688, partial [Cronartium quercuum f. sp. fusiforme G11]